MSKDQKELYSANGKTPNYDFKSEIIMCFWIRPDIHLIFVWMLFNWIIIIEHWALGMLERFVFLCILFFNLMCSLLYIIIFWKYQKHNWLIAAYLTPSLSILRPCNTWLWALTQSKRKQNSVQINHI